VRIQNGKETDLTNIPESDKCKTNRIKPESKFRKTLRKEIRNNGMLYLMALPAVVCLIVFSYFPMVGLVMAFQNLDFRKGIFTSPFVGFDNFKFLFATTDAWRITRNTVVYNVVFIVLTMFFSILVALLFNELTKKRFAKTVQTIFIMPHFLSAAVVSMIVNAFLNHSFGYANSILESMGKEPVFWYNTVEVWPYLLVFIYLWKHTGYQSILYSASIAGISSEYYEAAVLDGASRFKQAWYITVPHLRTIMCINLIRSVGRIFRADFGLFYSVPQDSGALYPVTDVLDTYIYRGLMTLGNVGMSSAAAFYQSVVGLILVLIANKIVKSLDSDSAMF